MWAGIPDTYRKLPESDSGRFRYTRSRDYQTPTRHALLGSGRCWKTGLLFPRSGALDKSRMTECRRSWSGFVKCTLNFDVCSRYVCISVWLLALLCRVDRSTYHLYSGYALLSCLPYIVFRLMQYTVFEQLRNNWTECNRAIVASGCDITSPVFNNGNCNTLSKGIRYKTVFTN